MGLYLTAKGKPSSLTFRKVIELNFCAYPSGIKVTLKNLKLINGKGSNGGCIFVASGTEITLDTMNLEKCIASNGGGLYSSPVRDFFILG